MNGAAIRQLGDVGGDAPRLVEGLLNAVAETQKL
jgi:hypothetical protein